MSTVEKPKKMKTPKGKSHDTFRGGTVLKAGDVTSISKFTGNIDKSRFNVKKVKNR